MEFVTSDMNLAATLVALGTITFSAGAVGAASAPAGTRDTITGTVHDARGPVAGAHVRVQGSEVRDTTDKQGRFVLPWLAGDLPVTVTAWASGFYVGWATATPAGGAVTIVLKPYYTADNVDYEWFSDEGVPGTLSCSHCMPAYIEWQRDAHSRSAINPRFLSMYNGTDFDGHQSPPTRFVDDPKNGPIPERPEVGEPYFGPGFKLDYPTEAGPCAACHVPVAAVCRREDSRVDPNQARGVERDGVACEFCHKIGEVELDPLTHLPHPDRPGVLSVRLFRPAEGQQLFFGPFDDVTRRVSYLPLEEESAFCAPCHHGVFSGTTVYDSYGEWLASPYSDPRTGKTCQSCHMPPAGYDSFVYPEKDGLRRNPARVLTHTMPGAANEELLRNALTMHADAEVKGGQLTVLVTITNDKTGHDVPTDSPLRHMILLVSATDAGGHQLAQIDGPKVPTWGGVGRPEDGYYAGLAGKAFAKVLKERWTGVSPTGAYWNQTVIVSDNRIAAFATDSSSYTFAAQPDVAVTVDVKLLFRRAYKQLADLKKWNDPDLVMASEHVILRSH